MSVLETQPIQLTKELFSQNDHAKHNQEVTNISEPKIINSNLDQPSSRNFFNSTAKSLHRDHNHSDLTSCSDFLCQWIY